MQHRLELQQISKSFFQNKKESFSLKNICLKIKPQKIAGVLGPSGCGKTTLGSIIGGLIKPEHGEIIYNDKRIKKTPLSIQMIFQEPKLAFHPYKTIYTLFAEILKIHKLVAKKEIPDKIASIFETIGIDTDRAHDYPYQFSAGQLQRLAIARSLLVEPDLLVCDEITSNLDMSAQAKVINLLLNLREEKNLSLLFISHNRPLVEFIADDICHMQNGQIIKQ